MNLPEYYEEMDLAIKEARNLMIKLAKAETTLQITMINSEIANFLRVGSQENITAFGFESWKVGRDVFQTALNKGFKSFGELSELQGLTLACISSNWITRFKEQPREACVALIFTHKKMLNENNTADNMFNGLLQENIEKQIGKSAKELINIYV